MTAVDMGLKAGNGVTISNYTAGPNGYKADWRDHLFVHEYGHYVQSQQFGPAFLPVIGIPSIQSAILYTGPDSPQHDDRWFEADASYKGAAYFDKYYGSKAEGYSPGSPDYFNREGFIRGTENPYQNPRTGGFSQSENPIKGIFHSSDIYIHLYISWLLMLNR